MHIAQLVLLSASTLVAAQAPGTNTTPSSTAPTNPSPGALNGGAPVLSGPPHGLNAMNQTTKFMGQPGTAPTGQPTQPGRAGQSNAAQYGAKNGNGPQFSGTPMLASEVNSDPAKAVQIGAQPSPELVRAVAKLLQDVAAQNERRDAAQNEKRDVVGTPVSRSVTAPTLTTYALAGLEPIPVLEAEVEAPAPSASISSGVGGVRYVNAVSKAASTHGTTAGVSQRNSTTMHYPPPIVYNATTSTMSGHHVPETSAADVYQNANMIASAKQVAAEGNTTTTAQSKHSTESNSAHKTSNAAALSALGSGLGLVTLLAMML